MRNLILPLVSVGMVAFVAACATEPSNQAQRQALVDNSQTTLKSMEAKDAGLADVVNQNYAYVVFPDIGKGGFGIGGAWGRGVVYEQGRMVGFAAVTEGSIGLTAGGQTYSELIVFKDPESYRKFQNGNFTFDAQASAVALKAGAAAAAQFRNGVMVFIHNQGGLMADASIGGQKISFHPTREFQND
jgi:lipid-binding SYLF domain-containing protein